MKKTILSLMIISLLVGGVDYIPEYLISSSNKVSLVTPVAKSAPTYLYATGKITPIASREIYINTPVYPSEITVEIGDYVNIGDVIANIDTELTSSILTASTPLEADLSQITKLISQLPDKSILYEIGKSYNLDTQQISALINYASYSQTEQVIYHIEDEIISPFSGTVTNINLQENAMNYMGEAMFTISDLTQYKAVLELSQQDIKDVMVGMETYIECNNQSYRGIITAISPVAKNVNLDNAVVEVIVDIPYNDELRSGFTVTGKIVVSDDITTYKLPIDSVNQDEDNTEYVYVYQNSIPVKTPVQVQSEDIEGVWVSQGVTAKDLVISNWGAVESSDNIILVDSEE